MKGIQTNGRRLIDQFRIKIHSYQCVYCGLPASTNDHFPPRNYSSFGYILRACQECNSLLWTSHSTNFGDRCKFIKLQLKRKHSKILKVPDWSKSELDNMGHSMMKSIQGAIIQKKEMQNRIMWDPISFISTIDVDEVFIPSKEGFKFDSFDEREFRKIIDRMDSEEN